MRRSGSIRASGNKNGALPILAATVLASDAVVLSNLPRIRDVEVMVELLVDLGADAAWTGQNEVRVDSSGVSKTELDPELCSEIRASFLLAGPLLARFGRAVVPPPGGESLKDTLARALPFYMIHIQPLVLSSKRVLVSAHGNSLRALIMAIEGLTPEQILKRELETGVPVCYRIGADSRPISVETLSA